MQPEFSVIIPVYNTGRELLNRCISSVLQQNFENFELILVDDGSKDDSGEICDEFAKKDSRIKVIHKQNGGVTTARNTGIDSAIGKYLFFIDNDDWIESNALSSLYGRIKDLDIDFAYYDSNKIYSNGNHETAEIFEYDDDIILNQNQKREVLLDCLSEGFHARFNRHGFLAVWCKVYNRDFINKNHIRFYEDLTIADDVMFNIDCCLKSTGNIYYAKLFLYNRFVNLESDSSRYHPEISINDKRFLKHLKNSVGDLIVNDNDVKDCLMKRYAICIIGVAKYDMAHKDNPKSHKQRTKDLKELSRNEPYKSGIKNANLSWFRKKHQIYLVLLRMHLESILVNIHNIQ